MVLNCLDMQRPCSAPHFCSSFLYSERYWFVHSRLRCPGSQRYLYLRLRSGSTTSPTWESLIPLFYTRRCAHGPAHSLHPRALVWGNGGPPSGSSPLLFATTRPTTDAESSTPLWPPRT